MLTRSSSRADVVRSPYVSRSLARQFEEITRSVVSDSEESNEVELLTREYVPRLVTGLEVPVGHNLVGGDVRILNIDFFVPDCWEPHWRQETLSAPVRIINNPLGARGKVAGYPLGRPKPGSRLEFLDDTAQRLMQLMHPTVVDSEWSLIRATDVRLGGSDCLMPNAPFAQQPGARVIISFGETRWFRLRLSGLEPFNVCLFSNSAVIIFPGTRPCSMQIAPLTKDEQAAASDCVVTILDYEFPLSNSSDFVRCLWGR